MEDLILEIFNKIKLHNCKINRAILYRNFYIVKIEKKKDFIDYNFFKFNKFSQNLCVFLEICK